MDFQQAVKRNLGSFQLVDDIADGDSNSGIGSDDFLGLFTQEEACVLIDLLKLGVANRAGPNAKETVSSMLLCKLCTCVD